MVFFPQFFVQYIQNNFVTNQFNKTKLTGCVLEKVWRNRNHTDGQRIGTVNALCLRNGSTEIHQIYRKFLAHANAQNKCKFVLKF